MTKGNKKSNYIFFPDEAEIVQSAGKVSSLALSFSLSPAAVIGLVLESASLVNKAGKSADEYHQDETEKMVNNAHFFGAAKKIIAEMDSGQYNPESMLDLKMRFAEHSVSSIADNPFGAEQTKVAMSYLLSIVSDLDKANKAANKRLDGLDLKTDVSREAIIDIINNEEIGSEAFNKKLNGLAQSLRASHSAILSLAKNQALLEQKTEILFKNYLENIKARFDYDSQIKGMINELEELSGDPFADASVIKEKQLALDNAVKAKTKIDVQFDQGIGEFGAAISVLSSLMSMNENSKKQAMILQKVSKPALDITKGLGALLGYGALASNPVGAIALLAGGFSALTSLGAEDPNAAVMKAMDKYFTSLSKQILNMQSYLEYRLDQVVGNQIAIHRSIVDGFRRLSNGVDKIFEISKTNKRKLDLIYAKLDQIAQDGRTLDYRLEKSGIYTQLEHSQSHIRPELGIEEKVKAYGTFKARAAISAQEPIYTGRHMPSEKPDEICYSFKHGSIFSFKVGQFLQYASQLVGSDVLAVTTTLNPIVWSEAVNSMIAYAFNSNYPINKALIDDAKKLQALGRGYSDQFYHLAASKPLFLSLLASYEKALTDARKAVEQTVYEDFKISPPSYSAEYDVIEITPHSGFDPNNYHSADAFRAYHDKRHKLVGSAISRWKANNLDHRLLFADDDTYRPGRKIKFYYVLTLSKYPVGGVESTLFAHNAHAKELEIPYPSVSGVFYKHIGPCTSSQMSKVFECYHNVLRGNAHARNKQLSALGLALANQFSFPTQDTTISELKSLSSSKCRDRTDGAFIATCLDKTLKLQLFQLIKDNLQKSSLDEKLNNALCLLGGYISLAFHAKPELLLPLAKSLENLWGGDDFISFDIDSEFPDKSKLIALENHFADFKKLLLRSSADMASLLSKANQNSSDLMALSPLVENAINALDEYTRVINATLLVDASINQAAELPNMFFDSSQMNMAAAGFTPYEPDIIYQPTTDQVATSSASRLTPDWLKLFNILFLITQWRNELTKVSSADKTTGQHVALYRRSINFLDYDYDGVSYAEPPCYYPDKQHSNLPIKLSQNTNILWVRNKLPDDAILPKCNHNPPVEFYEYDWVADIKQNLPSILKQSYKAGQYSAMHSALLTMVGDVLKHYKWSPFHIKCATRALGLLMNVAQYGYWLKSVLIDSAAFILQGLNFSSKSANLITQGLHLGLTLSAFDFSAPVQVVNSTLSLLSILIGNELGAYAAHTVTHAIVNSDEAEIEVNSQHTLSK